MNVNLELTDHCNIRCRMCSQSMRDLAHGAEPTFMSFDTWRKALQGLAGLPDVNLCPHWLGEPTLHPRFEELVEYAFAVNPGNRLFRHFKLHTNAVLFSPERSALLLRLAAQSGDTFEAIHFSIDAHSRDAYQLVKGADRQAVVYRNVARFLEQRGAQARPVAHLAFVVQEGSRHEIVDFVRHWGGLLDQLGRRWVLTAEWPPMDQDAIYVRRLNTGDQAGADRWHAEACAAVGLVASARAAGSF